MGDARETEKAPDAFRTISEVAEDLGLPQHVLRFWETRFVQIKPVKRGGGRRFYRPEDVDLLRGIRHLLYGDGYTIKGVQKILKEHGIRHVQDLGVEREAAELRTTARPRPTLGAAGQDGVTFGGLLGLLPRRRARDAEEEAAPSMPELPLPFPDPEMDREAERPAPPLDLRRAARPQPPAAEGGRRVDPSFAPEPERRRPPEQAGPRHPSRGPAAHLEPPAPMEPSEPELEDPLLPFLEPLPPLASAMPDPMDPRTRRPLAGPPERSRGPQPEGRRPPPGPDRAPPEGAPRRRPPEVQAARAEWSDDMTSDTVPHAARPIPPRAQPRPEARGDSMGEARREPGRGQPRAEFRSEPQLSPRGADRPGQAGGGRAGPRHEAAPPPWPAEQEAEFRALADEFSTRPPEEPRWPEQRPLWPDWDRPEPPEEHRALAPDAPRADMEPPDDRDGRFYDDRFEDDLDEPHDDPFAPPRAGSAAGSHPARRAGPAGRHDAPVLMPHPEEREGPRMSRPAPPRAMPRPGPGDERVATPRPPAHGPHHAPQATPFPARANARERLHDREPEPPFAEPRPGPAHRPHLGPLTAPPEEVDAPPISHAAAPRAPQRPVAPRWDDQPPFAAPAPHPGLAPEPRRPSPGGWHGYDPFEDEAERREGALRPPEPLRHGPPEQYLPPHLRSEPRVVGQAPVAAPVLSRADVHRLQATLYELSECRRIMGEALRPHEAGAPEE